MSLTSHKLISVIIPVYNHAHILKQSIGSLLAQTYRPLEIIIVNDGSTDNFNDIAVDIKIDMDKNKIPYKIINQKNLGATVARNLGFKESRGDYIIFWDADTIAKKKMLEIMCLKLEANPQTNFVYSGFKFGWKKFKCLAFNEERLKKFNYIDITSLLKREDFCGFDESLKKFQDWDLWLTLIEKNKQGIGIPQILYKKIVGSRTGISFWLPKIFYKLPFKISEVDKYKKATDIILKKHQIK